MPDAPRLPLLEQEVEQPVVEEAVVEIVHPASTDAVQQVVVDIVHPEAFHRAQVHFLGRLEIPELGILVGHFGGDEVFVSGMPCQRISRENLRLSPHIHRRRIEIVHPMGDGIVDHGVHLFLVVGQSHHAESEQRHLFFCAVLDAVGHSYRLLLAVLDEVVPLRRFCYGAEGFQCHHGHGRSRTESQSAQELPPPQVFIFFFFHKMN